jgi:hypothetical protein
MHAAFWYTREPSHLARTTRLRTSKREKNLSSIRPTDNDLSIWHNGRCLIQWNEKQAQHLIRAKTATDYWTKKQRITVDNQPAWDALYQAFTSTNLYKKLWIPKWLTSWVPIGKKLKQWKIQTTDECPGVEIQYLAPLSSAIALL